MTTDERAVHHAYLDAILDEIEKANDEKTGIQYELGFELIAGVQVAGDTDLVGTYMAISKNEMLEGGCDPWMLATAKLSQLTTDIMSVQRERWIENTSRALQQAETEEGKPLGLNGYLEAAYMLTKEQAKEGYGTKWAIAMTPQTLTDVLSFDVPSLDSADGVVMYKHTPIAMVAEVRGPSRVGIFPIRA